jgi:hypothetical protein
MKKHRNLENYLPIEVRLNGITFALPKRLMKKFLLSIILIFSCLLAFCQPTDNPYRTFYPNTPFPHFTDSIAWNRVWNFNDFQDTTMVARYNKARDFVAQQGGGVLYFPAGTYAFENSIQFKANVVIRGATPTVIIAKDSNFAPPTRFVFPQYFPSDTGLGTLNSTAFKSISASPNTSNAGIVFVDVNRANVSLRSQTFVTVQTSRGSTSRSIEQNRNLIIFGVRSNNVASPFNTVPAATQHKWQRFSSPFASNISIYAWKNACIANCRINDFERNGLHPIPNLSFPQPGYLAERQSGSQIVMDTMQGFQAMFNYTDHHGISMNRKATITNATPEEEPGNFCPGLEIRDNWIYKTMRVGIICSGLGIKIDGNLILDKPDKQTWLHPQGIRIASNNAATYENRGIDFGGWDVQITNNEAFVYRHKIYNGPYYSVDGEGILLQECCGGTSINGAYIAKNKTHDCYIGLWKVRDINHVVIDSNETGDDGIFLLANTGGAGNNFGLFSIRDSKIRGNKTKFINVDGNRGGRNLLIEGNIATGTGRIDAPCFAEISNNSGFNPIRYTAVKDTSNWGIFSSIPCQPDTQRYPLVWLEKPLANDTAVEAFSNLSLRVRWQGGRVDSVFFFQNTQKIGSFLPGNNQNEMVWNSGNCTANVPYQIWAMVKDTSRNTITRTEMKNINPVCVVSRNSTLKSSDSEAFPNPFQEEIQLKGIKTGTRFKILNGLGRLVWEEEFKDYPISLKNLPIGLYFLFSEKEVKPIRLLKN